MIDRAVVTRVRKTQVAPVLGNVLSLLTADNRHQELLDEALRLIAEGVSRNEELIRQRIREESPWWLPEAVDDRIHDKVVRRDREHAAPGRRRSGASAARAVRQRAHGLH